MSACSRPKPNSRHRSTRCCSAPRAADEAEADEPELDIPAEIERREKRLEAIAAARQRLEQRQREADTERGRKRR